MLPAAAARYNYVIIDSPPLLAAADALVLSSVVDGVILIVCAGKTRRKELQSAVKQLHEVEANVIGVVLNRMKNNKDGSYRYYQYYDKAKDVSQEKGQKETLPHQKVTKKEIASQSQSA
jgi:Mrp family chromosome partitioning ATPase